MDNLVAILENTGNTSKKAADRLISRLEKYDIETLSYMYDFNILFDNNLAE